MTLLPNQLQGNDTESFQYLSQSRPGNLGPGAPQYKPKDPVEVRISPNQSCVVAAGSFSLVERDPFADNDSISILGNQLGLSFE